MSVQKKISLLREAKGLTQSDVAKELKMCVTEYGDIERGDADPKVSKLQKVANFYGIRLSDLLDDSDKSFMNIQFSINRDQKQNNVYLGSTANSEVEKQLLAAKDKEIEHLEKIISLLETQISELKTQLKSYQPAL